jgi:UDP-N-acetylglucosamine pyrophosphorylase
MSGTPITMNKLRKVIVYYTQGKSKSFISTSLRLSRNTVSKYISHFISLRISLEELNQKNDLELELLFLNPESKDLSPIHQQLYSFFPYVEKRLRKKGMTKQLLWEEYKSKHPDGVQSTQFCEHFNRWQK